MECSRAGSAGCVVHVVTIWRVGYIVDSCNFIATEHGRYGLSCM